MRFLLLLLAPLTVAAQVPFDTTGVSAGPISINHDASSAVVRWQDEAQHPWEAVFNLDAARPLLAAIRTSGKAVVENAVPLYSATVGKRRGGFDEFFDFPPSHPDGTGNFQGVFRATGGKAVTIGDRMEVTFEGFLMGPFRGTISYTFYPGSRLIQQAAIAMTDEPDTAYFYDAGLRMAVPRDVRPGNNMDSEVTYYNTAGVLTTAHPNTSEKLPVQVRYRTLAARAQGGAISVFPAPHKYFMPRDFTTNMGYLWHTAFRGQISLGIRQLPDDNSRFYPWMNAPPGTAQRMNVFFLVSDGAANSLLDEVARYTNRDHFPKLPGYVTVAPHWHFAYTVQAMAKPVGWVPPFKPVLKAMGVDAAIIADFHGDGHPQDQTDLRLRELKAYFDNTRAQSDATFLLIPSEEANVHYGGHWAVTFPRAVYWIMAPVGAPSAKEQRPGYGTVYTIGSAKALLEMMRAERGMAYQTHPRTKGSKEYPDKIRTAEHFVNPTYFGAGWKQMPADMSSPRQGERSLKLLDDMNNWGLRKRLLAEVDVFQIDSTHELYAHMNINYVQAPKLPAYDNYGQLLRTMERAEFFVSTGEVLMPSHTIAGSPDGVLRATAQVQFTFPLEFAELVWGDGTQTHRKMVSLTTTRSFGKQEIQIEADAPQWRWARLAVWDIAGNGAFVNPVWR